MRNATRIVVKELKILLLQAILFVFAMFQGGFVSWFLFYSMLPIVIYMMIIPVYPLRNWQIERDLSARYLQAGSSVEVRITIKRTFRFPIFCLVIEEEFPDVLRYQDMGKKKFQYLAKGLSYAKNRTVKKVLYPGFRKEFTLTYQLDHLPRGKHQLSDLKLRLEDPFGFVAGEHHVRCAQEFYVFPVMQELKWKQQTISLEDGTNASVIHDERVTNVVSSVREYVPGDRFSWIDWKTSARKNTMMTKEFEQEKYANIVVILQMEEQVEQKQLIFEAAIEWTASLIHSLRKKDQSISFYTLGGTEVIFSHQQLQFQFPAVRNYLATIEQEQGASLKERMAKPINELSRGSMLLFVIYDLDKELVDRLVDWQKREYTLTVCYIIPEKQLDSVQQKYIQTLRLQHVQVQVITEQVLLEEQWEVRVSP
ncbi:DUF58 domain-containing protein [Gracilibacillus sp. S3-1-1]|uniref:DUF58 domain-containing protein n=1 Tax=Gracilibacillus pellucidus TaxID=3095368 RepID=A0ACC6M790_9BACI|nr:DUF58 domain-containing protein [Gracilibacillus sp. S3-1-1]MDX8046756.1 DUF58 domain-containing protein [Gracilibacillus sp. S3-1-1]